MSSSIDAYKKWKASRTSSVPIDTTNDGSISAYEKWKASRDGVDTAQPSVAPPPVDLSAQPAASTLGTRAFESSLPGPDPTKAFLGGVASGLSLGLIPKDKLSAEQYPVLDMAGEVVGSAPPILKLGKLATKIPALGAKALGPGMRILNTAARDAAAGFAYGTARETTGAVRGEKVSPTDVATESALWGVFGALGGVAGNVLKKLKLKRLLKKRAARTSQKEIDKVLGESTPAGDALAANETIAPSPNVPGAPHVKLRVPTVTRGTERVLRSIPLQVERSLTTTPIRSLSHEVETSLQLHEKLGTKGIMYYDARAAENAANVAFAGMKDGLKEIKKAIPLRDRIKSSRRIDVFSKANQAGGRAVLKEMGITEIPKLNRAEMRAHTWMEEKYRDAYNKINKARIASGVSPFGRVKNYSTFFRNLDGELKKGYNIVSVDPAKLVDSQAMGRFTARARKTPFRFEKKRMLDDYGPLELDAFSGFERYMHSATRHEHITPVVAKIRQMLDGKFYSGFKLKETNPQAYKDLNDWLNFYSGMNVSLPWRGVDVTLSYLNQSLAFAVLGYSFRSAVIQPTALRNTLVEIGPRWTTEGALGIFNKKARKFMIENSNHLASREMDVAVSDAMQNIGGKFFATRRTVGNWGLWGLKSLDGETARATWWGAYQKGTRSMNLTKKEAINYADDVVVRGQASAARVDVSPLQRSALGKFVGAFQTFVITDWNFLTKDVVGIGKGGITPERLNRIGRYLVATSVISSIYEDALGIRSPFASPVSAYRRELDKSGDAGSSLQEAAYELLEPVPVIGGGVRYGSNLLGAGVQLGSDLSQTVRGQRSTARSLEAVGKLVGFPGTTQIRKGHRLITAK